ncbi:hypothetical protein ACFLTD_03055, partial [Elusimicrobiota bacterium]
MDIDDKQVAQIVREVIKEMDKEKDIPHYEVKENIFFREMEHAIEVSRKAQGKFQDLGLEIRKKV